MSASKPRNSSEFECALRAAKLRAGVETLLRRVHDNMELNCVKLRLGSNQIAVAGAQALARALETNTTVHTIDLGYNRIAAAGAEALAHTLEINTTVHTLDLRVNQTAVGGAQAIARALETNTTVRGLNLSWNGIAVAGAQAIARALVTNTTVHSLDLGENQIGVAGAQAVASALETNTTVHTLNLRHNEIADVGAQALARALETNTAVHTLDICFNQIAVAGAEAVARALEANTTLRTLDVSRNQIADAGAQVLARALGTNTTLRTLDLISNHISNAGAQALAYAVWRSRLQPGGLWYETKDGNGRTWDTNLFPYGRTLGDLLRAELPTLMASQDDKVVLEYIVALRQHFMCLHTAYLFGFARDRPAVLAAYRRDVLHDLVKRVTDEELPPTVRETWQNGTNSNVLAQALTSHPMYTVDVGAIILEYADVGETNRAAFNWLRQLKTDQSSSSSSSSSFAQSFA